MGSEAGTDLKKLSDVAQLPQPPLVEVLPREGELPVREAVEVVLGVVDELGGFLHLPEVRFESVEGGRLAAALLLVRYPLHDEVSVRGEGPDAPPESRRPRSSTPTPPGE